MIYMMKIKNKVRWQAPKFPAFFLTPRTCNNIDHAYQHCLNIAMKTVDICKPV